MCRLTFLFLAILFSLNAWGFEYEGKYLSPNLTRQLALWKQQNKKVNNVYLTGSEWVANSGKDVQCSASNTLKNICQIMNQIANAGGSVLDVARAPTGEFVILSTNGPYYSHPAFFESIGLVAAISQFTQAQKRVNSVALFENQGWLIIAQGEVKSKNIPPQLRTALEEARLGEHYLLRIFSKFINRQNTQWILTASADYWTNQTDRYLQPALHKFMKDKYYLGPVALDGPRFIALVNHKRFLSSPFDLFENDIKEVGTDLTQHILARMEHYKVPGITVAVIDGDTITTRTYGVLSNATNIKARTLSYYPSASLSKAVFSYGMLRAHERGVLNLDKTVFEFSEQYPNGLVKKWVDSLPSTRNEPYEHRSKVMTLRSLLSHSGGTSVHGIGTYNRSQMRSLSDLIMGKNGREKTNPIDFPHQSIRYSGGGYSLVEAALEDATGKTAGDWLTLNVLAPLKMEHSTFSMLHPEREINLARGHLTNSRAVPVRYCPGKGAGGLITNAFDYAKFLWSVMNEARIYQTNQRFLSRPSHQKIFTPAYRQSSSLESCGPSDPCQRNGEICSLNKCLLPATDTVWNRHHGPGQMHSTRRVLVEENQQSLYYPVFTEHGGRQSGVRTNFEFRYAHKKGIVILTNAEPHWIDGDDIERGANLLIDELKAAFRRHW